MSVNFPPCPPSFKGIQHYLKVAQEHDGRDIVVSYWSRLYALQLGLKQNTKQPDETTFLLAMMDWLENTKKEHAENESITNEVAAQAHLENYALKLFMYADQQDRASNFGKNVVKAFYTSGMIYDVMQTFGELTEEASQNRKYAKWKAAYIHNCLKNGETPVPGPMNDDMEDENMDQGEGQSSPQDTPKDESPSDKHSNLPEIPPEIPRANLNADEVLNNPEKLPSPPVDEEKPGGFIAFKPEETNQHVYIPPQTDVQLAPEQITKAQKYCRYAGSALSYDDIKTAIENLQKALHLLTTGQDQ